MYGLTIPIRLLSDLKWHRKTPPLTDRQYNIDQLFVNVSEIRQYTYSQCTYSQCTYSQYTAYLQRAGHHTVLITVMSVVMLFKH